jgi:hypothetical protein
VRPAPLLAVAVSAVLGIALGVGAGLTLDHHGPDSPADPLSLGISLRNQSCSDDTLLVVATGDSAPPLAAAVAEDPHLSYLDTSRSCATAWTEHGPAPRYIAYLGPYASREQACSLRMTAVHRGDFVTRLHDGNTTPVRCVCYVAYTAMPVLTPGMHATVLDGIWIRAMQRVISDLGFLAKGHLTSFYDPATVAAVKRLQHAQGLRVTGIFDSTTWHALITKGCRLYES